MNFFTPALELNKYVSYKRLTFYIDLTVAIIFCQLGLAFCKRRSSTAWKRKTKKTLFGTNMLVYAPAYKMLAVNPAFFFYRAYNYCPMKTYHSFPAL